MIKNIMRFWNEERSLTALLVLLAINMFVLEPVIKEGTEIAFLRGVFSSLLLLTGLLTMTRHKTLRMLFAVFVTLTMMVHWARIAFGTRALVGWDAFLLLLSMLTLMVIVLAQVNQQGPVTGHRVRGAVVLRAIAQIHEGGKRILKKTVEARRFRCGCLDGGCLNLAHFYP